MPAVALAAGVAALLLVPVASAHCYMTVRDYSGGVDDFFVMNYNDDTAVKRLGLVQQQILLANEAKLWVFAKASECSGASGSPHTLYVNGGSVASFNSCSLWPTGFYEYEAFTVPLNRLVAGTNSFQIRDGGSSWTVSNLHFPLTAEDHGHSDARWDGTEFSGELMWYLELKSDLVCL